MNIFESIAELLKREEPFVLATVLTRSGSAPRHAGSRMIVHRDGTIGGTIGGGILEARTIEAALGVFESRKPLLREFVLTSDDAGRLGMICGGRVEVLINYVDPHDPAQLRFYEALAAVVKGRKRARLVTCFSVCGSEEGRLEQALVNPDGSVVAGASHVSGNIPDAAMHRGGARSSFLGAEGRKFVVEEDLCDQGTVFIFGAGHIGAALGQISAFVGFGTIVLDDRKEFANRDRFPSVDEIVLLDSFANAFDKLSIDADSCIVIVTRGHVHDKTVLRQALRTRAGYVGMIGSRSKRDAIFDALIEEGFSRRDLARVHAPIGLPIGAETPEEIAVCILGELIQVRAERNR